MGTFVPASHLLLERVSRLQDLWSLRLWQRQMGNVWSPDNAEGSRLEMRGRALATVQHFALCTAWQSALVSVLARLVLANSPRAESSARRNRLIRPGSAHQAACGLGSARARSELHPQGARLCVHSSK